MDSPVALYQKKVVKLNHVWDLFNFLNDIVKNHKSVICKMKVTALQHKKRDNVSIFKVPPVYEIHIRYRSERT